MTDREPLQPTSASQREVLEVAVSKYEAALAHSPEGVRYLAGRGLSHETASTFRLGVVSEAFPGHARYEGWLAIPYLHKDRLTGVAYPKGIRFRCLSEHQHRDFGHGKYMSLPDTPSLVFNVRAIHEAGDEIHVTEGEFDAMVLNQIGLPAVAIPGASGFAGHHRRMLAGFNRVWVWGDPDEAGAAFTNKICSMLRSAKGVYLKSGDVTDNYLTKGDAYLRALVAS